MISDLKLSKPTRAALLRALEEVQGLVGEALGAFQNDQSSNRAEQVQRALNRAFDVCVDARAFDPPPRRAPKRNLTATPPTA